MDKPIIITINDEHGRPVKLLARLKWVTKSPVNEKYDTCGVEILKGHPIVAMLDQAEKEG